MKYNRKSRINVDLSPELIEAIQDYAVNHGLSRNQAIALAIKTLLAGVKDE